jgi:IS66 C-terminal element
VPPRAPPLIETARLNDVDPEAWHGDVINHKADHPNAKIEEAIAA